MGERTKNWILGILAAAAIGWVLNGGASRLSNAATERLSGIDHGAANAAGRARAAHPDVVEWLSGWAQKIAQGRAGEELRDLRVVPFLEGIRSEALGGRTLTGCFYDGATGSAYFDVGFLAILDRLAMPRPDLTKAYVISRVLAEASAPVARGAELDRIAGGLAEGLGWVPPGAAGRNPALWRAAIQPGLGLSGRVHEHLPPGWSFPLPDGVEGSTARGAEERAAAFLGGMTALPAK